MLPLPLGEEPALSLPKGRGEGPCDQISRGITFSTKRSIPAVLG
jgi:hypothetical protein